jgi:hypothetical protein
MKLMPMGDYYLWYCEWCDSRNLTLWTKVTTDQVCCAACHKKYSDLVGTLPPKSPRREQHRFIPLS